MKTRRKRRNIGLLCPNFGARPERKRWPTSRPGRFGNIPGTHYVGDWVDVREVWTGAENLALTGIRTLDRTAHSDVAIPTTVTRSLKE